jgi:hypothetical protein
MKNKSIGITLILMGFVMALWGNHVVQKGNASIDWPSVPGVVVWSSDTPTSDLDSGYSASLVYEYTVRGEIYRGSKISYQSNRTEGQYPLGKMVTVRYDPENPEVAVLVPGAPTGAYLKLILGILAAAGGVVVIAMGLMGKVVHIPLGMEQEESELERS